MPIIRVPRHTPLKRIGEVLQEAKSVLIFTHVNIDGDCFGSAMAMCRMLRRRGKEAWVLLTGTLPAYLTFLTDDGKGDDVAAYCTFDPARDIPKFAADPDVCLAVDCSDERRFKAFADIFERGKTVAIDHHTTNTGFASMNYVDDRSANGENIWRLFRVMGETPTKEEAEALYTAIVTDTGRFQYGSVNAETLRIVAHLYDCGMDQQNVTVNVYQSDRPEKVALHTRILSRVELLAGGRIALSTMSLADLAETGAAMDETEGVVEDLRNMAGVEVACFIREAEEGGVKVSLRSKRIVDVAAIAAANRGGGHLRASGFSANTTLTAESERMRHVLTEALEK